MFTPSNQRRRIARLTIAMPSIVVMVLTLSVGTVLGWAPPSLAADCAPDQDSYAWTITLPQEPDYLIQLSWNADFSDRWTVDFGSAGSHAFTTDRDGHTLFARWKNDNSKSDSQAASADLCEGARDASLNIHKVDEQGNFLAGAVFTVEGMEGTFTSNEDGEVCITGLPDDSEWLVTEIQAPDGYELADPNWQMVEVDDDGDCNSPDAVFVNPAAEETPTPTPKPTPTPTPQPSESESPAVQPTPTPVATATPREGVAGGNPTPVPQLPDTAIAPAAPVQATVLLPVMILALSTSVVALVVVRRR
jgi:hypothetical protein